MNVRRVEVCLLDGEVCLVLESGEELRVLLERGDEASGVTRSSAGDQSAARPLSVVADVVAVPRATWQAACECVSQAEGMFRAARNGDWPARYDVHAWLAEVERLRAAWRVPPAAVDVTPPAGQA